MKLTLSVLDQSPVRCDGTAAEALRETVELAQHAERLGYERYWVSEHHNSAGFAGTAPEILIGQIAANTRHIRVGSGGVMLTHYSALKVAEQFRILSAFYPGRMDLGIGRAPGSDQRTLSALTTARESRLAWASRSLLPTSSAPPVTSAPAWPSCTGESSSRPSTSQSRR
jgi:luciferase family oxidoreductase group 1